MIDEVDLRIIGTVLVLVGFLVGLGPWGLIPGVLIGVIWLYGRAVYAVAAGVLVIGAFGPAQPVLEEYALLVGPLVAVGALAVFEQYPRVEVVIASLLAFTGLVGIGIFVEGSSGLLVGIVVMAIVVGCIGYVLHRYERLALGQLGDRDVN